MSIVVIRGEKKHKRYCLCQLTHLAVLFQTIVVFDTSGLLLWSCSQLSSFPASQPQYFITGSWSWTEVKIKEKMPKNTACQIN